MPVLTPDEDGYEHGNIHNAEDIRRVAREMGAPRDVVPTPERGNLWDETAAAAGQPVTLIDHVTMLDVEGVPNGVVTRHIAGAGLGRPPGYPTIREEIEARYADPRAELGDEYDPEIDGPLPEFCA